MIETLDDIIEQLADSLGVYGSHDDDQCRLKLCRVCWTARLKARIEKALEIAKILTAT